jgi:hypothetical protein
VTVWNTFHCCYIRYAGILKQATMNRKRTGVSFWIKSGHSQSDIFYHFREKYRNTYKIKCHDKGLKTADSSTYHFHVSRVLRSWGQSSVESAAYRAGERLAGRYYGKIADYTAKGSVICSEILASDYVPELFHNREYLWNAVEEIEKHPKAQLAYSFDFALQNEFSLEENITITGQFVLENFVAKGMIVDMVTVCELVDQYLKTKTGVRQSTKQGYVTVQRLLAKKAFGKKTIRSVKTSDVKLFLIKLQQEDGKSYSSIHTIRGVLRPAFQMAVDDDNGMPLVAMHWQHRFNHMIGRYNDIYRVQMESSS